MRTRERERERESDVIVEDGTRRETGENPKKVDSGDGRRSISWLQGFQASPAHPYYRNVMKIKMLERQTQCFEKKGHKMLILW